MLSDRGALLTFRFALPPPCAVTNRGVADTELGDTLESSADNFWVARYSPTKPQSGSLSASAIYRQLSGWNCRTDRNRHSVAQ
jgi:hypothetical protein